MLMTRAFWELRPSTAQKMKFSIEVRSHYPKKSLIENFIFFLYIGVYRTLLDIYDEAISRK